MQIVHKAVPCVIRRTAGPAPLLLVFRHPLAGVQIPKGTVEPGEDIATATLRELAEETGLTLSTPPDPIGTWDRIVRGGDRRTGPWEVNRWHLGLLPAPPDLPDQWQHRATGSPQEDGLIFDLHWLPLDADLPGHLDPLFTPTAKLLLATLP